MTLYALFLDGRQISKAHTTRQAVVMEAFERGAVERRSEDFPGDPATHAAPAPGYEIRPIGGADFSPMTDDPILANPEALTEIAIRAFTRAKREAIEENDRLGIPSYGTGSDGKIVVRYRPDPNATNG
jgi:hypothetical protein